MKNALVVDDDYRIITDSEQFILQEKSVTEKGKYKGEVRWGSNRYYSDIHHAFGAIGRSYMLNSFPDIKLALTKIEELKTFVHKRFSDQI